MRRGEGRREMGRPGELAGKGRRTARAIGERGHGQWHGRKEEGERGRFGEAGHPGIGCRPLPTTNNTPPDSLTLPTASPASRRRCPGRLAT